MNSGYDGVNPQVFSVDYRQAPAATSKNWMGVAALVSAFVVPMAGIVFGILGLKAAGRGLATNRALSIAGIIISVILQVLAVVILVRFAPWLLWLLGGGGDGEAFCEQMGNIPWGC